MQQLTLLLLSAALLFTGCGQVDSGSVVQNQKNTFGTFIISDDFHAESESLILKVFLYEAGHSEKVICSGLQTKEEWTTFRDAILISVAGSGKMPEGWQLNAERGTNGFDISSLGDDLSDEEMNIHSVAQFDIFSDGGSGAYYKVVMHLKRR